MIPKDRTGAFGQIAQGPELAGRRDRIARADERRIPVGLSFEKRANDGGFACPCFPRDECHAAASGRRLGGQIREGFECNGPDGGANITDVFDGMPDSIAECQADSMPWVVAMSTASRREAASSLSRIAET